MPLALVLTNLIIALSYYAIAALVGIQLFRARSRGVNLLGCATAGIFLTCGLGHSVHVAAFLTSIGAAAPGAAVADPASLLRWLCGVGPDVTGTLHRGASELSHLTGTQLLVDALTVVPALGFLALRRRYGLLVDGESVILDYQRDLAGERARVAERTAELASAELRARELAEARAAAEQAAAALHRSETFLRTMIAAAPVGIVTVGPDQTIQEVNPALAALLGAPAGPLRGRPFLDFIHPDDRAEAAAWAWGLWQGAPPTPLELRVGHQEGQVVWVSLTASVLRDGAGQPTLGLGIVQDMTARRAMEERLRTTQRLESLGVLAGGIAHDFNNILTSVLGHAELASLDLDRQHPARHDLEQIVVGAQRAAELVSQMLAYAGKGQVNVAPAQLSTLVQEMADLLQVSVGKHARLVTRLDPALPLVNVDASQLRQVVLNLLTNAAEAIGAAPGTITLTTVAQRLAPEHLAGAVIGQERPAGDYVGLIVSDTGGGIAPEVQQRIFDPFFTTKFTGRGLGLAAVQGIVHSHQGVLAVSSEPGRGATFQIWLPAASSPAKTPQEERGGPALGGGALLIIDDEAPVRAVLAPMLERCGYQVVAAADGPAGLALLPTIAGLRGVFIDLTMPAMEGKAVAARIHDQHPALPLVLMSGYSTDGLLGQDAPGGVVTVLQKPYRLAAVLRALEELEQAWGRRGPRGSQSVT